MTPFDAVALVTMLTVFYPTVSAAALATARTERPAYFAGGTLGGSSGTLLALGDGRVFALADHTGAGGAGAWSVRAITAAGPPPAADVSARTFDPATIAAWVATYAGLPGVDPSVASDPSYWVGRIIQTGGLGEDNKGYWVGRFYGQGGDTPDGLSLDPGPLTPIDASAFQFPQSSPTQFEDLVSGQLGGLDGSAGQLDSVEATVTQFDPAASASALDDGSLDEAQEAHDGGAAATAADSVDDIAGATDGQRGAVSDNRGTYDDPPPPDQDVPDPGPEPDKPGPGDPGGPPPA